MDAIAGCEASVDELREMITAALAGARREGVEAAMTEIEAQEPVGWQQRTLFDGKWSNWQDCNLQTANILRQREDYEVRGVYARSIIAQAVPMSDERIDAIADLVIKSMPDGLRGFIRTWGYHQFARALLDVCAGYYRPVPAQAVLDEQQRLEEEAQEPAAPTVAPREPSPTTGMSIEQRILHVGGRNNSAGYVEFGSVQAVTALVRQALRDIKLNCASPAQAVPDGKRQAVLLTDERLDALADEVFDLIQDAPDDDVGDRTWDRMFGRAIETAVLEANGPEVRHG